MKKLLACFSLFIFLRLGGSFFTRLAAQSPAPVPPPELGGKINWSIDPFEHAIFVENTGQFTPQPPSGGEGGIPGENVLFEAKLGSINAFFTSKGIIYRHIETNKPDGDPDGNGPQKKTYYYLNTTWDGANTDVIVSAAEKDKLSYYYTYPKGYSIIYTAEVYTKITYHNLYPGIDVVYSFPEGSSNLEYSIIVHPGFNLDKVRLKYALVYPGGMSLDGKGNVIVRNEIGTLTESAPVAYYLENHKPVSVSSVVVNSPFATFCSRKTDSTKTLIIDPVINWTTNPNFTGGDDNAYDLDYDNAGNVYVYGSGPNPFQLVKLNQAGVIQWVFNATLISYSGWYGDFAVDKHSQECYAVEGWDTGSGGAKVLKVSSAGFLLGTDSATTNLTEMWRIVNTTCPPGSFVIFGGGIMCYSQAVLLDTTMSTVLTPANVLAPLTNQPHHDMSLAATDPSGSFAYTATNQSLQFPSVANNYTLKCPVPTLAPSTYRVQDHFAFKELV